MAFSALEYCGDFYPNSLLSLMKETQSIARSDEDSQHWVEKLQNYPALKEQVVDFVFDAEDEIAVSLEKFSAKQLSRWASPKLVGLDRAELATDMFITEGQIRGQPVIQQFLATDSVLASEVQAWLSQWTDSFTGLFEVTGVDSADEEVGGIGDRYQLMNWLTEKSYSVYPNTLQSTDMLKRLKIGEIVLARLVPLTADEWTFAGSITLLGKLGKPKLAVAIGNFKKWFPEQLYGDAPELKEAAWDSVKQQYEDFIDIFGPTPVTLPGKELNEKLQTYQQESAEKQLASAGIDSDKSFLEMAKAQNLSDAEIDEALAAVGDDNKAAKAILTSKQSLKMVMPKVELPDNLRKAQSVTVFSHPRWGQSFLPDYHRLETLANIAKSDRTEENTAELRSLVLKYLEGEQANAHVWQHIQANFGETVEPLVQELMASPKLNIQTDFEKMLASYDKLLTPTLPESANVPIHLHNLFQDALKKVGKSAGQEKSAKKKSAKKTRQKKGGFG
ncbi:hypothetical protein S7335_2219 [Synechococcus sp. PCC 7335]|uniref:hypothetical protein n=1 Tax=Synechococcus sp. (strain ATCC 29403 / PCC 7335) TaxID=91464 RepID=UPI00017EB0B6|nr:hypothetical protein [Synechococcus sp. PCC 7335]EDX84522.1 hypothetical protein S7335_2219 [Synechococcus sp. PCC 7335]